MVFLLKCLLFRYSNSVKRYCKFNKSFPFSLFEFWLNMFEDGWPTWRIQHYSYTIQFVQLPTTTFLWLPSTSFYPWTELLPDTPVSSSPLPSSPTASATDCSSSEERNWPIRETKEAQGTRASSGGGICQTDPRRDSGKWKENMDQMCPGRFVLHQRFSQFQVDVRHGETENDCRSFQTRVDRPRTFGSFGPAGIRVPARQTASRPFQWPLLPVGFFFVIRFVGRWRFGRRRFGVAGTRAQTTTPGPSPRRVVVQRFGRNERRPSVSLQVFNSFNSNFSNHLFIDFPWWKVIKHSRRVFVMAFTPAKRRQRFAIRIQTTDTCCTTTASRFHRRPISCWNGRQLSTTTATNSYSRDSPFCRIIRWTKFPPAKSYASTSNTRNTRFFHIQFNSIRFSLFV